MKSLVNDNGSLRSTTWILFVAALVVFLPGIGWGLPGGNAPGRADPWGSDELGPWGPVTELYSVFLAHRPFYNPQYPLFGYFLQLIPLAPYVLLLWLRGGLSQPSPSFP